MKATLNGNSVQYKSASFCCGSVAEKKFIPSSLHFLTVALALWHNSGWHHKGHNVLLNASSHQTSLPLSTFVCWGFFWGGGAATTAALAAEPCIFIHACRMFLTCTIPIYISESSDLWSALWYLWCVGPYSHCFFTMSSSVFRCSIYVWNRSSLLCHQHSMLFMLHIVIKISPLFSGIVTAVLSSLSLRLRQ